MRLSCRACMDQWLSLRPCLPALPCTPWGPRNLGGPWHLWMGRLVGPPWCRAGRCPPSLPVGTWPHTKVHGDHGDTTEQALLTMDVQRKKDGPESPRGRDASSRASLSRHGTGRPDRPRPVSNAMLSTEHAIFHH